MARKKSPRQLIKLRSAESGFVYISTKNRRNDPARHGAAQVRSDLATIRSFQGSPLTQLIESVQEIDHG